jgi:hypothetical protein
MHYPLHSAVEKSPLIVTCAAAQLDVARLFLYNAAWRIEQKHAVLMVEGGDLEEKRK